MNDDQIKNAIEAIKSQLPFATSKEKLEKLTIAGAGLLSFAAFTKMESQVKELQADLKERLQEAK